MKKKQNSLYHIVIGVIFLIIAITFFLPFIKGDISFIWDTRDFGFTYLNQVSKSLIDFKLPLWNSGNFSGYPFAADIESMMFYPIFWIFTLIFKSIQFTELPYFFIFHFFIGSIGAYSLSYKFTKNIIPSFLGAIIFTYSGYALGHISHLGQVISYMWIPFIFYTYIIALEKKKLFFSLLAGLIFGISILVGHFNTSVYVLLGLFILTIFNLLTLKDKLKTAIYALITTIFALMIASISIFPVYELAVQSNRSDLNYEQHSENFSLNPLNLPGLIFPNFNKILSETPLKDFNGSVDITQNYLYIGLLPLIFSLFFIFEKNAYKWFFFVFGFLTLLAAFGKYTFVDLLIFKFFPGFNKTRMSVQIMGMVFFSLSILVSLGSNFIYKKGISIFNKKSSKIIFRSLFFILCIFATWSVLFNGYDKRFYSEKINPNSIYDNEKDLELFKEFENNENDMFRISDELSVLKQNKWQYYGFENIWGTGGIKIKKYNNLFDPIDRTQAKFINNSLLDFTNVKYIFSDRDLPTEHFEKLKTPYLYKNKDYLPRAYIVKNYIVEPDENKQYELIKNNEIDFKTEAILSNSPTFLGNVANENENFSDNIKWIKKTPSNIKIQVELNEDSTLVLSEIDYNGWNLKVDNVNEKYINANYIFRAVPLKKGSHIIEFYYSPSSVYIGASISIITIIIFIVSSLIFIKRKQNE